MLDSWKGQGRRLMYVTNRLWHVELVMFADGSLGIRDNGKLIGCWERCERTECLSVFASYLGDDQIVYVLNRGRDLGMMN